MHFRRWGIAWQMMTLAALGALAGFLAMLAITFIGPAPFEPPHGIDMVARAMNTARTVPPDMRRSFSEDLPEPDDLPEDRALAAHLAEMTGIEATRIRAWNRRMARRRNDDLFGDFVIAVRQDNGWMVLRNGPNTHLHRWLAVLFMTVTGVLAAFLLLAWLVARRIARPMERLAAAARRARTGGRLDLPDVEDASPEVRDATLALGELNERTIDHAHQRVTMLAAISHDVGTPLARLAFRAEGLGDEQREAAMKDIAIIRQLLQDSLTLARTWNGAVELLDLAEVCRELVEGEAETGHDVTLATNGPAFIRGNHLSIRRMVQNLVDNALRYGVRARLHIASDGYRVVLGISDDGPGFPEDIDPRELLRPYVRGEASRNRDSGGSGLGLAIAAQVAAQHGGTIDLGRAQNGGAQVTITLPVMDNRN